MLKAFAPASLLRGSCGAVLAALFLSALLTADPVPVRFLEGSIHGFLALRTTDGKVLAMGDLVQVVHGSRVVSHLVFRFRDGSIDDETAIFSQRGTFRLLRDHHIQKGKSFPKPVDVLIDTATGNVTTKYRDKGQLKEEREHLDLPADLTNGVILNVLKNIDAKTEETKLSYLASTPKPRIVKLSIKPQAKDNFFVAGVRNAAVRYRIKVELGGLTGLIAPLVGKEPAEIDVWVAEGESPAFVKSEGPMYLGGPIWRIEMTSPVWPNEASK